MGNPIRQERTGPVRSWNETNARHRRRTALQPVPEALEDRQLLSASLPPIPDLAVPAQMGYQVPLDGSGNTDPTQSYTATSDNPDIQVSVAQGPFWTLAVQHTSSGAGDPTFSGSLTFQLFNDLTPSTVAHIIQFTNDGYYTGKDFSRIANEFPGPADYVALGGAPNPDGTGQSGQPGTPFANEIVQQLAFTGTQQLAMANAGLPTSNDTSLFVTTGTPTFLDFHYTVFGQLVAGSSTLAQMTLVATSTNPALGGEKSLPVNPIVITSATLSSASVNGVLHVDTTSARAGETANITVTATDPTDGSMVTRTFKVTTAAYNGPADPPINLVPFTNPVVTTTQENTPVSVQLHGQSGYPDQTRPGTPTYRLLSQPAHGTISQFNPATGSLVYTPNPGYSGQDSLQYLVQGSGPEASPAITTSRPATISILVKPPPLVTLSGINEVFNKAHRLTQILVHFSADVNAAQAGRTGIYRLALPGRKGSYSARNAPLVRIRRAAYNSQSDTVTLQLQTPLALFRKAQLRIAGLAPIGLTDSLGRLIDGDHNGTAGGDAIAYLSRTGVSLALERQATSTVSR
jgi:cyclophilin family peptidyl-prolyl cis-trans isomerase